MVGIPAYNEERTIGRVVAAAREVADEVVVVDDGSQDDTVSRASAAGATIIVHAENRGYGGALGTIFDHGASREVDHLVILDGDGQHDPEDIPHLIAKQQATEAELVIGSRFADGAEASLPLYRRFGLGIVNGLMRTAIRLQGRSFPVTDTQSGFRAYNREAVESLASHHGLGDGMDASLGILFHAVQREFVIEEVPTTIDYDVEDPSSQHPVTHGLSLVSRIAAETLPTRPRLVGFVVLVLLTGVGLGLAVTVG